MSTRSRFRKFAALLFLAATLTGPAASADYLAMSGADLYKRFCASCHGTVGRGDGPVANSLAVMVPDLTLIARRHAEKFPSEQVEKIIDGRFVIVAHGTREMPIWGQEFMYAELGNTDADRATRLVIKRLLEHVQSLQQPPAARSSKSN